LLSEHEIIEQFKASMEADGVIFTPDTVIIPDGEDHYPNIVGEKHKGKGGYKLTIASDGFAFGNYCNFKTEAHGKWHTDKNVKGLSAEKRAENEARIKKIQKEQKAKEEAGYKRAAKEVVDEMKAFAPADPEHEYLINKGVQPFNAKQDGANLIIPMYNSGKLVSYQRIFPNGEKRHRKNGRKKGSYLPLIKKDDDFSFIFIAEGFSTGATIREAMDMPVYIAFDAGNTKDVALFLKNKYKNSKIVICADNDQDTLINGKKYNTGLIKANQAAVKVGGCKVIFPEFKIGSGYSDFNDLYLTDSLEAVKDRISLAIVDRGVEENPSVVPNDDESSSPTNLLDKMDYNQYAEFPNMPFKYLGRSKENDYYYYSFMINDILKLPPAGHTNFNLMQLATIEEWESSYQNIPLSKIPPLLFDKIVKRTIGKKLFNPDDRARGTGVWREKGDIIVNCGDKIYKNNELTEFYKVNGKYVYISGESLPPIKQEYDTEEFLHFRNLLAMPTWDMPSSGMLLAGWIAIAPLCSSLNYRPHVFITGESNSGKSIIVDIVRMALKDLSFNVDGDSTEASIRQTMGRNAQPVIFDEAEGGTGSQETSIDKVLTLMRAASTGGSVKKYGQDKFVSQSPFCLSAVNAPMKKATDESRISTLKLNRNRRPDAEEHFKNLMIYKEEHLNEFFSVKLFSYIIEHETTITANMETLRVILRERLKDPRAAQLISIMLSGWHILGSTELLTPEAAKKIVDMNQWGEHTTAFEDSDSLRLINYLNLSLVKVNCGITQGMRDATISEIIYSCLHADGIIDDKYADSLLKNYSIRVEKDFVYIGHKNPSLSKILRNTIWGGNKWKANLLRIEDATEQKRKYLSRGDIQNCAKIPIKYFIKEEIGQLDLPEPEEIPFD